MPGQLQDNAALVDIVRQQATELKCMVAQMQELKQRVNTSMQVSCGISTIALAGK